MDFFLYSIFIRIKVFISIIKKFYQFLNIIKFTAIVFMSLRYFALVYCATLKFARKSLFFLLLLLYCPSFSQTGSGDDLKKEADKLFKEEQYTQAYKLYSQLVANFPKDAEYNYRLGVCMIYSEPDKKKCLPYLKFAANSSEKELKDVRFYLGKGYHINYLFDEAIKNYNEFKKTASSSQLKKLQVDREIKACVNGKRLLSSLTDLEVISKTSLPESDYFRNYKKIGGKLLVKPDDFKTGTDKKKKEKSVVFLPTGSTVVYYSSYGDNDETGKDIYTASKLPDGTYGKAEKVKGINTEFDEDYPFLHPDGKTLYFASKGHNSMGGYDIFKAVFNEASGNWGAPVNLEFPINSPDDDYLFVTDSLETIAYFSTGRQSPPGKIDVLKVKTKRKPIDVLAIRGTVLKGSPDYSLQSKIYVKDLFTQDSVTYFEAGEDGNYDAELPNGSKLVFTVETPGLETQSAQVSMPLASASKPFKQTISYDNGKLKVLNYFDEQTNDDTYLQYLKVIEKKARLDVNEGTGPSEPTPLAATESQVTTTAKDKKDPKITAQETPSVQAGTPDPKKGLNNQQLANMARQDAEESRTEAAQLNRDYLAANETAKKQKEEADKKLAEANEAVTQAEAISNEDEKKSALENALKLKQAAENDQAIASRISDLAKSLDDDAKNKQKEADLNTQYASELEKSMRNKNNKESLAKLEQLEKQISDLSTQKNESDNVVVSIKNDIEQKEKQLADVQQTGDGIKANLEEIKTAISEKETELANTKKKSAKQNLTTQINELTVEKEEKEKQIALNTQELNTLNDELAAIKNELELATKITSENINPTIVKATETKADQKITAKTLEEKYKGTIVIADASSLNAIESSNTQISLYNQEIDALLTKNKTELNKTKNKTTKQELTNEIKRLETVKKQNQQLITENDQKRTELSKANKVEDVVKSVFEPVTATTLSEAVTKLDNLTTQLNANDNENFDFNGYQNPVAQNLKVEADAKINDAIARQKKLKDEIADSKNDIQKNGGSGSSVSVDILTKEADDLNSGAQKLREEAKTKKGSEKENLIEEAKQQEVKANEKYIQAAEVTRGDNAAIVLTNQENIQNLIREAKASEMDINRAKTLNDEAKLAFRKAADIRLEANSLTSTGAKLGSYSNAEEKEAEAISKQQQAVLILSKSNPAYQLKVPFTSTSSPASESKDPNLNSKFDAVNAGLDELAKLKIESYQKLYEANVTEIDQLNSDLNDNKATIDNTPSQKSDLIAGNNKIENAKKLKERADTAGSSNAKLNTLIAAIKKQNEAIKQLNTLNASLSKVAETKTETPSEITNIAENTPVTTTETTSATATEINTVATTPEETNTQANELSELGTISTQTLDLTILSQQDTTTGQVVSYFDSSKPALRNEQAGTLVKTSISQLRDLESQTAVVSSELERVNKRKESGDPGPVSPEELKEIADELLDEAEPMINKALELKKKAETKEGEDKNYLLAQARELDIKAQNKMIEASEFTRQGNENEYSGNANAIDELIAKLKTDKPEMASEMEAKREEYAPLKNQVKILRDEANALNNKAAKVGAISNAEEKELELLQKQTALLNDLKKEYPDYVVKPVITVSPEEQITDLNRKKTELLEKQYTELTNLTNAFSLEFESSKNAVPSSLGSEGQSVKQNAEDLNSESKRLLIKSAGEKNETEKIKLLTMAAKAGNIAVEQLNKLLPKVEPKRSDLNELDEIGNRLVSDNSENPVETTNIQPVLRRNNTKTALKIDGLEVVRGNAYSASNPIPMNAAMEDGLVFRVQIGAFKTQLPNNAFKGLSPLNGETTASGYFRYTAGNFNKIENANAVKNDLRNLGYRDAFVVVYFNGKRITLGEALAMMNQEGKTVDPNAPQTAGITANTNVPKAAVNKAIQETVVVTKELEQIDGLLYTIQIGVYTKQITKPQLLNLRPIFREQLTNGLYRYTAGIYNNPEKILSDKTKIIDLGVRDAFVSAYLNGRRISFVEAKERQATDATIKMEPENPVVFPEKPNTGPSALDKLFQTPTNAVEPFKNDVSSYPAATADNGIKTNEEGICFKVQIGAFSKQVPGDVAAKFSAIKSWPIDNKQINGLFVYNVGNFAEPKFAKSLKDELVRMGISDAFITVYKDGKKIYGPEAESYLR